MDPIYFISSNKNKQNEIKFVFEEFGLQNKLEFIEIELPEIQGSPEEIIQAKCGEALKQNFMLIQKKFFVEDTSLHLDALHGFPGPYIKDFERIGLKNIFNIVNKLENPKANAVTIIGYCDHGKFHKILGETVGTIVNPALSFGYYNFGFDPIFRPLGNSLTFSEMIREDKYKISHRTLAVKKLIIEHII